MIAWDRIALLRFVTESNAIESITRPPTDEELDAHDHFLSLQTLTVADVEAFVATVADAHLRERVGMDVRIGGHLAPLGGPGIRRQLEGVLSDVQDPPPWSGRGLVPHLASHIHHCHHNYERLHPFTDGNGRSGRVIWLWQMVHQAQTPTPFTYGFLRLWYYQSLSVGIHA